MTAEPLGFPAAIGLRPEWMGRGHCRGLDPEMFYPERGEVTKYAKAVCDGCPVRAECLEHALTEPVERFGIWGGVSERERRKLRRKRASS